MPTSASRPQSSRGRLAVTVTAPDGATLATRGLGAWLMKAAPSTARGEVTVALVSDSRMRTLNRSFRGKDYATDVLSFPTEDGGRARDRGKSGGGSAERVPRRTVKTAPALGTEVGYLGDIVIATGVAHRQADDARHSVATELRVLALHGLLHLLGYDHERDAGEMARAEARLRKKAGLPRGVLSRSSR